jgi:uncharacterized protein (TIGR04255 family)
VAEPHPQYARSTIVQAFCQLIVQPAPEWTVSRPLKLYEAVEETYPKLETISQVILQFPQGISQVGADFARQNPPEVLPRLKFTTDDGRRSVVLGQASVIFECAAPYPGWSSFKQMIAQFWGAYVSVARPVGIRRATVRYVNRIERSGEFPRISDWLRPSALLPAAAVNSEGKAYSRIEAADTAHELSIVTLGIEDIPTLQFPPIFFDIDRQWTGEDGVDEAAVLGKLEVLHEEVWQIFAASKNTQLEAYLRNSR